MTKYRNDGGLASRKLWFAVFTSLAVVLGAAAAVKWPLFSPNYEVMIGGLLGVLGIYLTGNLGAKYVLGKTPPTAEEEAAVVEKKKLPEDVG